MVSTVLLIIFYDKGNTSDINLKSVCNRNSQFLIFNKQLISKENDNHCYFSICLTPTCIFINIHSNRKHRTYIVHIVQTYFETGGSKCRT